MKIFRDEEGYIIFEGARIPDRYTWLLKNVYGHILDIGCNVGTFKYTQFAPNCCGVDLDDWGPDSYGLGFFRADAHALPFKDGEFDVSVLSEILEHVRDPVQVLKEARRVAKDFVFITVPFEYAWNPAHRPLLPVEEKMKQDKITYEELFKRDTAGCKEAVDNRLNPHLWHIRYYTPDTLCEDLEKAGLNYKIEMMAYFGYVFFVGVLN